MPCSVMVMTGSTLNLEPCQRKEAGNIHDMSAHLFISRCEYSLIFLHTKV